MGNSRSKGGRGSPSKAFVHMVIQYETASILYPPSKASMTLPLAKDDRKWVRCP